MPVLESVQERKLTAVLINRKNGQLFRTVSALSFILFWQTSVRMANVSSYRFVSVVFVVVVFVNVQFSFAVLPAIFVSCIY